MSRDPIGESDSLNMYAFISNSSTYKYDVLGASSDTSTGDAQGSLKKGPWVIHPRKTVYAGTTEDIVPREHPFRGFTTEERSVNWKVSYKVRTFELKQVDIVGKGIGGIGGRGTLAEIPVTYWRDPDLHMARSLEKDLKERKKTYSCRKEVKCKAKCECGEKTWTTSWSPLKGGEKFYVYGYLVQGQFTKKPGCKLFPKEKQRAKLMCTEGGAKEQCRDVPGE